MMIKFDEAILLQFEQHRQSASALTQQERYLRLLGPLSGQRVFELGCGSGAFCRALVPQVAPDGCIVGLDQSPEAVELAHRLSSDIGRGRLSFEQGDGHHLHFTDNSFDVAVCVNVLAFCHDPIRVLGELRRILRPGGRLLVANSDEDTRLFNGHDRELGRRIMRIIADRGYDPWLGRRLAYFLKTAGFCISEEQASVNVEREFSPGTEGYIIAQMFRNYSLTSGGVSAVEYDRWLADLEACAQEGSYCYSVTKYAYLARCP